MAMKLLFCDEVVGTVDNIGQDGPEVWASFQPNDRATPLLNMWQFITNEDNYDTDPPFPEQYLDDRSWCVEDEDGTRRGVFLPAIYSDGAISWRWRNSQVVF